MSSNAHGMYDTMYTANGIAMRQTASHTAGMPTCEPRRSHDGGGGDAGGRRRAGSSGSGIGANGPKPARPATTNPTYAVAPTKTPAKASEMTGSPNGPNVIGSPPWPNATAARNRPIPRTAGAPTAKRTSSSDQATGRRTQPTTAARVSPIMMTRKVRLAPAVGPDGALMAMKPRTVVAAMSPPMRSSRPSAERMRMRTTIAPMAYAPTHFEASGEPEQDADDRHDQPERTAPPPGAGPDRREQGDGGDDEQPDVGIVHRDPRLDEVHRIDGDECSEGDRHRAPTEQDPRQQVDEGGGEHARQDARQAPADLVVGDVDRSGLALRAEGEQLLAICRGVWLGGIEGPRRRLSRQGGVGVDRVAVGLDHVDGRARLALSIAEDMDHLGRDIEDDPSDGGRHRERLGDRRVGGRRPADPDDGHLLAVRDVQHRVAEAGHGGQTGRRPVERALGHDLAVERVDERHTVRPGGSDPRAVLDRQAGQLAFRDRLLDLALVRRVEHVGDDDRAVAIGDDLLVVRRHATGDRRQLRRDCRRVGDLAGLGDEGIAAPAVGDLGHSHDGRPAELDAAGGLEGHELVGGGGSHDDSAVVAGEEVTDGRSDLAVRVRRGERFDRTVAKRVEADRGVEDEDLAGRRPDVQTVVAGADGHRCRARCRHRRDEGPGREIVGPNVVAGGDVQAVAGTGAGQARIVPPRLDGRVDHRHAEVARGRDLVLAEQDDPGGHRVLGKVGVGVLVDVVVDAVAPALEELGRRPGVIDLVEVHRQWLREPERPERQGSDDEHDDEPQVEPAELAARLAVEAARAVRPGRPAVDAASDRGDPGGAGVGGLRLDPRSTLGRIRRRGAGLEDGDRRRHR